MPPADVEYYRKQLDQPDQKYSEMQYILLVVNNEFVGFGSYERSIYENKNRAIIDELYVDPKFRKKGYGTKILEKILEILPDEVEIIDFWALQKSEGKEFFDNLLHAPVVYLTRQSVSEIQSIDLNKIKEENRILLDKVAKKGYEIRLYEYCDFDDLDMTSYIQMDNAIRNDMTKEDSSMETANVNIQRFMNEKDRSKELGFKHYTYVALKDNEPVGMTETMVGKYLPSVGWQLLTGVVHEHRGNRLGLALKSLMVEKLLEDTQVEFWTTDNAGSNEHMIKINDILGYKEWVLADCYEMNLKDAIQKLSEL